MKNKHKSKGSVINHRISSKGASNQKSDFEEESYFGSESEDAAAAARKDVVGSSTSNNASKSYQKPPNNIDNRGGYEIIEVILLALVAFWSCFIYKDEINDKKLITEFVMLVSGVIVFNTGPNRKLGLLYEVVLPPVLSLVSNYDLDRVRLNMVLSISPLLRRTGINSWQIMVSKMLMALFIDSRAVSIDAIYGFLSTILLDITTRSLGQSERGLFTALLVNLILLPGKTLVGEYMRLIVILPLYSLIPTLGYLTKLTTLSKILGHHKRPINAEQLKKSYALKIVVIFLFTLAALTVAKLSIPGIIELLEYIFVSSSSHVWILLYWSGFLGISIPMVMNRVTNFTLDQRRKIWHGSVVIMFLPTLFVDSEFTGLSFSIALILFLLIEIIRACAIPPWGTKIHSILLPYTDPPRDLCGPVIVSHIFLLLGISLPVLFTIGEATPLSSIVGIICLGLGDASASLIGQKYGKHKWMWEGSKKSLEGSGAFMGVVTLGLLMFRIFLRQKQLTILGIILTAGISALLEATSGMNDNVIVPLFMLILTQLSSVTPGLGELSY